jgi:hypothetical protein
MAGRRCRDALPAGGRLDQRPARHTADGMSAPRRSRAMPALRFFPPLTDTKVLKAAGCTRPARG